MKVETTRRPRALQRNAPVHAGTNGRRVVSAISMVIAGILRASQQLTSKYAKDLRNITLH
jgi:hypothetical protein